MDKLRDRQYKMDLNRVKAALAISILARIFSPGFTVLFSHAPKFIDIFIKEQEQW